MTVLVIVLALMFGQSHVYADQNVGITFGCTADGIHASGFEFVGEGLPGYYDDDTC